MRIRLAQLCLIGPRFTPWFFPLRLILLPVEKLRVLLGVPVRHQVCP